MQYLTFFYLNSIIRTAFCKPANEMRLCVWYFLKWLLSNLILSKCSNMMFLMDGKIVLTVYLASCINWRSPINWPCWPISIFSNAFGRVRKSWIFFRNHHTKIISLDINAHIAHIIPSFYRRLHISAWNKRIFNFTWIKDSLLSFTEMITEFMLLWMIFFFIENLECTRTS